MWLPQALLQGEGKRSSTVATSNFLMQYVFGMKWQLLVLYVFWHEMAVSKAIID